MRRYLPTFVAILLTVSVFIGCSTGLNSNKDVTKSIEQLTRPIQQVASRYGEPSPQIIKSVKDMTDGPTHQPMYVVFAKGNFSKGNLKASNLEFSILADGSKVWAIRAFDDNNRDIWLDNE